MVDIFNIVFSVHALYRVNVHTNFGGNTCIRMRSVCVCVKYARMAQYRRV